MVSKNIFIPLIIFSFFIIFAPSKTYASCFLNEYMGNQCDPPLTQNFCSCYLCFKKWAVGSCNYNGDPNGTLMHGEGYACTYECSTNGGGQDCPFCQGDDPACFLPGTKITTPNGKTNIEDLKPGDKVVSFDPTTQKYSENTVNQVINTTKPSYFEITTKSGKVIKATPEHPFFVGFETQKLSLVDKIQAFLKQLLSKIPQ